MRCHPNAHTATLCPWGTSPYDADAAHSHWGGGGDCVNLRRLVLPLAQATAAVRHRPRPVPWLQTPSRAAARRPGWRCPRPGPKAVPDVVGSAVAPQAARLGRREVPAKPLGCWPRRGGVHRSSRSRRARIASGRSVARVYMQPASLRSGLSGGLYTGYSPVYCCGAEAPRSFCVLLVCVCVIYLLRRLVSNVLIQEELDTPLYKLETGELGGRDPRSRIAIALQHHQKGCLCLPPSPYLACACPAVNRERMRPRQRDQLSYRHK